MTSQIDNSSNSSKRGILEAQSNDCAPRTGLSHFVCEATLAIASAYLIKPMAHCCITNLEKMQENKRQIGFPRLRYRLLTTVQAIAVPAFGTCSLFFAGLALRDLGAQAVEQGLRRYNQKNNVTKPRS